MATTLKNYPTANIGTVSTTVYNPTTTGIQSTVIGLMLANTTGSEIQVSVTLTSGATVIYLIKDSKVPAGNTLNIIGDGKVIVQEDQLIKAYSNVASSLDVLVSTVEVA